MAKSPAFNYEHSLHFSLVCPRCQLYYPNAFVGRILRKQHRCAHCGLHIAFHREFFGEGAVWMDKNGDWFREKTARNYHGKRIGWYVKCDEKEWNALYEDMKEKVDPKRIDEFFNLQDYDLENESRKFKQYKAKLGT